MLRNEIDTLLSNLLDSYPNVTDINMTVGKPFQVQTDEGLLPVQINPPVLQLTPFQTEILALNLLQGNPALFVDLLKDGSCECSYQVGSKARFRVNVFRQRGHYSIVLRKLSTQVPSINQLTLPRIFYKIPEEKKGMILIAGSMGTGKSTTLAAILQHINETRTDHILTLEDPIEFEYQSVKATFNQRELGSDFSTMEEGLHSALRQCPNVIMVGEIKTKEAMELAFTASENYLVLSTYQSSSISQAVSHIVGMFKKEEEEEIRKRFAESFRWIVCQKLVPKTKGGRIPIFEILVQNFRTKDIVIQGESENKQFYDTMAKGTLGMQTFDQNLLALVKAELITEDIAKSFCTRKTEVGLGIDKIKAAKGLVASDLGVLEMDHHSQHPPKT
ncbi:MAG: Flp pilus assembly complex ATPase component TadA [Candidatus Brocadiae bacterium]|nr:Flp pilus assembly complex ATPase component TadA [Candidatus Brocadiia bacterium]